MSSSPSATWVNRGSPSATRRLRNASRSRWTAGSAFSWITRLAEVVRLVAGLSPTRILDVACGSGYLTRHLRGDVVGLDQSAAMLRVARTQAPSARLVRGDGLALPFPDRAFGRVVAAHFYGHLLPDEGAAFLREARAGGGELVLVDAGPRGGPPRDEWQDRLLQNGSPHPGFKRVF